MCDITVFSHPDKKYDGNGVYLSQGVLKARQAVVFNVVLDPDGNATLPSSVVSAGSSTARPSNTW